MMSLHTVALVGATGTLGPSILKALIDAQVFRVTVLSRNPQKASLPEGVEQAKWSDEMSSAELTQLLTGQDALVLCFPSHQRAAHIKLIDAAVAAGVKRIVPADFGSCDSSDPHSVQLVPLFAEKEKIRHHLQSLEGQGAGHLSWTALVTGHFFDEGLRTPLLQFDLKNRSVRIFDDGEAMWSATTLPTIGVATARALQHPDETRNRLIFVSSVRTSQNELLRLLQRLVPGEWKLSHVSSQQWMEEHSTRLKKDPNDKDAMEELVSVEGIVNADWSKKPTFMNDTLKLPREDLEALVTKVVKETLGEQKS